jgi:hypothetical protein
MCEMISARGGQREEGRIPLLDHHLPHDDSELCSGVALAGKLLGRNFSSLGDDPSTGKSCFPRRKTVSPCGNGVSSMGCHIFLALARTALSPALCANAQK